MSEVDVNAAMDETVNQEAAKAALEADLVEGGRYRFQLAEFPQVVKDDKEFFDKEETQKNPWYGKTRFNLRMSLTSKRVGKGKDEPFETLDRPRTYWQKVSNDVVLNAKGEKSKETIFFGQMINIATKELGHVPTIRETLQYFVDHAGEVVITRTEEKDTEDGRHFEARNWTQAIKSLPTAA